ncbi:DUF4190 domain-containing protein [Neobacillus sp. PS2-9]|uniref:DUF4190 domain-containing protein n=1 Tax=Neobacillus sp. PS2-9 TaxID=3070676 RepID=UPI0027E0614E|nr:DUF4190 domain-containing protein [Neobacillus sp. PS2-9]WML56468.1 DUF4190 domain-containing protein [Neobacillus sp. PS2-9]
MENKISNGKAIASLILGILSIITVILPGVILGIIGLILGIIGLKEINGFTQQGRKMAVAGIICSGIGISFSILVPVIGYLVFMTNIFD